MMNKRFLPVILLLVAASFFIAFQSMGKTEKEDNPKTRYAKVLRNVGILLQDGHYSPKKIDDTFSATVLKSFLEDLDGEKNIFLLSDIKTFKKDFNDKIDDELKGAPLKSFYDINDVYQSRFKEVEGFYQKFLNEPMSFRVNESIELDPKKRDFPKDNSAREQAWRLRIKYLVLSKYADYLDEREKNKNNKDYAQKADSTLERESRDYVRKQMMRYFSTRKTRETTDQNFSTFVNTITNTMDPHTTYFPPIDLRSFNESMSGHFFGIGAQLKEDDGRIKISSLVTSGPAWKNGELKVDDEIIKVGQGDEEPVDVTGYSVSDAVKLIRGSKKGSEVRLTIRRMDGTIKVISLLRDDIKLEDTFARSAIINGEYKLGYIYLPEFYADFERANGPRSARDVAREVEKLKDENVEGIIVDLRGNGGGSLQDVIQMAGLFISEGPIVQVQGRGATTTILRDRDKNIQYGGPLVVMVDETSASASEIFAAAIQDYKRGIIIGSTSTFGKGTVQRNIPLDPISENMLLTGNEQTDDLGTVKLTLQKFYRINGGATQLKGVAPDIVLPDRLEYLKFREKDNPNALVWDEIKKADYKPWSTNLNIEPVISEVNKEVVSNSTFSKIKTNVQWLEKNIDKPISLKLDDYRKQQKDLKDVVKQIDELYKLKTPLNITNIAADTVEINSAEDKIEKNAAWMKRIREDIYIDESVKVMNKMITRENMVKSE